jgi:cysteine desulfurase
MGAAPDLARGAARVSLGAATTARQIADFTAALAATASQLRGLASLAA